MKMKSNLVLACLLGAGVLFAGCGQTAPSSNTGAAEQETGSSEAPAAEAPASEAPASEAAEVAKPEFPNRVVIGASAPGGNFYILGGIMGTLIKDELGVDASVQDTGGGIANVQLANKGEIDLGLSSNYEAYQYYNVEEMKDFVGMAPLVDQGIQIAVNADSDIHSISDLDGKIISLSKASSSHDITGRAVLEALGIQPKQIINAGNDDIGSMFKDGRVDAMLLTTSYPVSAFAEIDTEKPLRLLSFTEEELATIQEKHPYFGLITIPGGVYKGSPEEAHTLSNWNLFVVPKSTPEDVVYAYTKLIYDNASTFQSGLASAIMDPKDVGEVKIPLHPGAYRYFQEAGVEVPEAILPE